MKYNIAIKLPAGMRDKAIEMSKIVVNNGGVFELGAQNNLPHISIAHFECDDVKNIISIVSDVDDIIKISKTFKLKSDEYRVSKSGWVDVSFHVCEDVIFLYEQVVGILDKYNCKITSDDWRQKNAPHITFSRIESDEKFNTRLLPSYDFSFIVDEIELFERGAHGVCEKELNIFKLH